LVGLQNVNGRTSEKSVAPRGVRRRRESPSEHGGSPCLYPGHDPDKNDNGIYDSLLLTRPLHSYDRKSGGSDAHGRVCPGGDGKDFSSDRQRRRKKREGKRKKRKMKRRKKRKRKRRSFPQVGGVSRGRNLNPQ
jgi:hypothetical protein